MIAADNKIGNSPPPQWLAKTRIVLGTAGANGGARDSMVAVDTATGKVAWRKYVIPAPGEPGRDTWKDKNAWETDGGDAPRCVICFLPVTDDVLDLLCEVVQVVADRFEFGADGGEFFMHDRTHVGFCRHRGFDIGDVAGDSGKAALDGREDAFKRRLLRHMRTL